MSRYFATAQNGRGNNVSLGGRSNAGPIHLRGWDAGVKVIPVTDKNQPDTLLIYMTWGSHAAGSDILIGRVVSTPDGPEFVRESPDDTGGDMATSIFTPDARSDRIPDTAYHPGHP
jgi:hypothetical protein